MAKQIKQAELTPELGVKLQRWQELDRQLSSIKTEEFALRQELAVALSDTDKFEGVQSLDIGSGWRLKIQKVQNYAFSNEFGETEKLLAAIAVKFQRPDLATTLAKWTPEMSKSAYNEVLKALKETPDDEIKALLAAALTIKPGAPQLELVPPEAEKPAAATA